MTQLADAPAVAPTRSRTASPMNADPKQAHLENYAAFRDSAVAVAPDWVADLRENAIRTFARNGMPAAKAEAWRWTKHRPVTTGLFTLAEPNEAAARAVVAEFGFADEAALEIVQLCQALGNAVQDPGERAGGLAGGDQRDIEVVKTW